MNTFLIVEKFGNFELEQQISNYLNLKGFDVDSAWEKRDCDDSIFDRLEKEGSFGIERVTDILLEENEYILTIYHSRDCISDYHDLHYDHSNHHEFLMISELDANSYIFHGKLETRTEPGISGYPFGDEFFYSNHYLKIPFSMETLYNKIQELIQSSLPGLWKKLYFP